MRDAFAAAYNKGVFHVAAAGNSGRPGGTRNTIGYPARYASVLAVAAVNSSNQRPSWSSYRDEAGVSAPGVSILSTYLNSGYATADGTSMTSPHVAGAAALVVASGCASTPAEIRQRLTSTAKDLGSSGWDKYFGHGLIQADLAANCSGAPPDNPPVASFAYSCTGLSCSFNGDGSEDSDGSIADYSWTFGDISTGSGATINHTYASGSTYTVTLTITDDKGATNSQSQQVAVSSSKWRWNHTLRESVQGERNPTRGPDLEWSNFHKRGRTSQRSNNHDNTERTGHTPITSIKTVAGATLTECARQGPQPALTR